MKTYYLKISGVLPCMAIALLISSCSSNLSYNEALQKNLRNIEDSEKVEDSRFLVEATSYNLLATKMAEAAVESGYSASVVAIARQNLELHKEMSQEMKKLARKEDITLPGKMNTTHEDLLNDLTTTNRRNFDKAYIRLLTRITEEDGGKFKDMATAAQSEDIRAFAARKLDVFESHKRSLKTVEDDLLQTY